MYRRYIFVILFVGLISICVIPRFINLNWDNNNRIHPDEALIVNGALKINFFSDLNPGFHDYNGFSVYMLRGVAEIVSFYTKNASYLETPEGMTIIGRYISATASTLIVIIILLLIRQYYSILIAVTASIIVIFSPICIQLAHFYTTDTLLVLFLTCLIFSTASYLHKQSIYKFIAMAFCLGAAVATKNTGYFFTPIPVFAILFLRDKYNIRILRLLLLTLCSFAIFFLFSPYSILELHNYLERSRYLQQLVTGRLLFDWSMQFQHTGPLFMLQQTIWAFGPLSIFGCIGMTLLFADYLKRGLRQHLILFLTCIWTIGFCLFLSFTYIKFIRYTGPLLIGLTVGFSYLMNKYKGVAFMNILFYVIVVVQVVYGLMFSTIYRFPHTTVRAATWIANNIPSGAAILREDWNNIIRYEKAPLLNKDYRIDSINFYITPDIAKVDIIVRKTFMTDYIVLDSPKVKNVVQRLKLIYPISATWYRLIENEELGFVKVAEFTEYPHLGNMSINDELSEETFTVFDHPSVRIYKKQRILTEREIYHLLSF